MEDGYLERPPDRFRADESAVPRLPRGWAWSVPLLLLAGAALGLSGPDGRLLVGLLLGLGMALVALARAGALLAGLLRHRHEWCEDAPLAEDDPALPLYTVLVPLHRESAVLGHLLLALERLRYPRSRLRILLLVEDDDAGTREALALRRLPASVTVLVVPPGEPRTKPRACNYALDTLADGLAVVFDAEDRPDPDQLLRAAAAFRRLPETTACLQARLAADHRAHGLVGRLWGLEYAAWFDLFLPGLHAVGAPIPLGGTSNHFRAHHLRRLRWDAWNVTEDAELGIRLARAGLSTGVLVSTTWEEAPPNWSVWLRQRGRWLKGWWLTAATHLADRRSLRDLGLWRWLWMAQLTLGTVLTSLLLPVAILLAISWLVCRWPLADPLRPWTWLGPVLAVGLLLLHVFFLAAHAMAAIMRRSARLLVVVPALPIAWIMAAAAAWRGYLQSIREPHRWDKTPHGAASAVVADRVAPSVPALEPAAGVGVYGDRPREALRHAVTGPVSKRGQRLAAGVFLLLVAVSVLMWSVRSADLAGLSVAGADIRRELRRAGFEDLAEASLSPDADWSAAGHGEIVFTATVESGYAGEFEVIAWMKLWDGTWFERSFDVRAAPGAQRLALPLDDGWRGRDAHVRFAPAWLMRVREAGLRLRGPSSLRPKLTLLAVDAVPPVTPPTLTTRHLVAPATVAVNDVWDMRFDLSRALGNPFDAAQVDLRCTAEGPSGARFVVPCFFVLDHRRTMTTDGAEVMIPLEAPRWGARVAPDRPGLWRIRLSGHDAEGVLMEQEKSFVATHSDLPGPVRVEGRWFSRDQRFFYPLTINLRSPYDKLLSQILPATPQPGPDAGTLAMDPWIRRCADHGLNWMRVWTMPASLGLEWSRGWPGYHGRGVYNLANASRIDRLLATARERRVTVELALWQHGPWHEEVDAQWPDNPWNSANGGPLEGPGDALTDARVRAGQRNLLRYAAARWGPDPALAAWTLWIEVDGAFNRDTTAWHVEMADVLHRYDPLDHPVSTEFRTQTGDPRVFSLPGIDFTQVAAYDSDGLMNTFRTRAATFERYNKPVILEEYGGHATGGSAVWLAQQLHDGPWAAWNVNVSASPMAWWWNLIFAEGLDRYFSRFADYARGEDLSARTWRFGETVVQGAPGLAAQMRVCDDRAYAWIYKPDLVDVVTPRARFDWWTYARRVMARYEQNRGSWNPLAKGQMGDQFSFDGAVLVLKGKGLRNGRWRYECWDTWTDTPPVTGEFTLDDSSAGLPLPSIQRDLGVKLEWLGE